MVKFGTWTRLEKLATDIQKAVEVEIAKFSDLAVEYTSTALHIPKAIFQYLPWNITLQLLALAKTVNTPKKIPLFLAEKNPVKEKPVGWDYEGRNSIYWAHLLAKEYGWGLEYVHGLDVNVAFALIQEVLTDAQLEREFLWGMSEIAYPYNSTTKQNKFSPLTRPYFMADTAPDVRRMRIRRDLIPVGEGKDYGGMEKFIQETPQNTPT